MLTNRCSLLPHHIIVSTVGAVGSFSSFYQCHTSPEFIFPSGSFSLFDIPRPDKDKKV